MPRLDTAVFSSHLLFCYTLQGVFILLIGLACDFNEFKFFPHILHLSNLRLR